ncbi:hemolysin [Vibrio galatheae]|uniref:Hemolysin n=1 Tax=Vibrio galatheae TaxID=579748 RepID=A0A0F4NJ00_9VIBR|nr:DUF333 domain-containing protein [Vibrio galatheae]KJY82793.1 hemolysin [Vibrio galatheae]
MNKLSFAVACVGVLLLAGCANEPDEYDVKEYTSVANPASVYCVQQGGELGAATENGIRVTYCLLENGESVEQWEYYRQNHDGQ